MKLFGSKISKEEHNNVKQALEETNKQLADKIKVLESSNIKLTEEKGTLEKEIENLKIQHRKEVIAALHSGCQLKSEEALNWSINSYAKSNMTFEEIKLILDQLRCAKVPIQGIKEFPGIK